MGERTRDENRGHKNKKWRVRYWNASATNLEVMSLDYSPEKPAYGDCVAGTHGASNLEWMEPLVFCINWSKTFKNLALPLVSSH